MPNEDSSVTRRGVLKLAAAGVSSLGRLEASDGDFWNRKPPNQWTPEEIQILLNHSPWAKPVRGRFRSDRQPLRCSQRRVITPMGPVHPTWPSERPSPIPVGKTVPSQYTGNARWESAQPILNAVPMALSPKYADAFVISVYGIPMVRAEPPCGVSRLPEPVPDEEMHRVAELTTLIVDGSVVAPTIVDQKPVQPTAFLFGFPKSMVRLAKGTGDVKFSTWLADLLVEATFEPRRMFYRGVLAV